MENHDLMRNFSNLLGNGFSSPSDFIQLGVHNVKIRTMNIAFAGMVLSETYLKLLPCIVSFVRHIQL